MNITSVGAVSAYGIGFAALHRGLLSGTRQFSASGFGDALVGAVHEVATGELPRSATLALIAAEEALAPFSAAERRSMGVIVGGTTGGMDRSEQHFLDAPFAGLESFDAATITGHPICHTTGAVADRFSLFGPRATLISACSSGLNAVIVARQWLLAGRCERVLAIGCDGLCRLTQSGFAALAAIDPTGTRPFQRDRKGISIGEGAAAFVIEKNGEAKARVLGTAICAEAYHATQPDPSGEGAARAMRLALKDAALPADAIDAVSAHGTGTIHNDAMECLAIADVVGSEILVSSQKSQLGHTLGAAGALELAACIAMLQNQVVYATHGLAADNLDPACNNVRHVMHQAQPKKLRAMLKNSFAFGGQNACVVVGAA